MLPVRCGGLITVLLPGSFYTAPRESIRSFRPSASARARWNTNSPFQCTYAVNLNSRNRAALDNTRLTELSAIDQMLNLRCSLRARDFSEFEVDCVGGIGNGELVFQRARAECARSE